MIKIRQKGNFDKTLKFLKQAEDSVNISTLHKYGREGVSALMSATPVDSGDTAKSWYYEIVQSRGSVSLTFKNSNIQNGVPIAIILQYGHGTRNGGWVEGRDYINPTIKPVFDRLANSAWGEVIS